MQLPLIAFLLVALNLASAAYWTNLKDHRVQTQVHYPEALPFTKEYSKIGFEPQDFPVAYRLQNESLSLPLFPGITEDEQAYLVENVIKSFENE